MNRTDPGIALPFAVALALSLASCSNANNGQQETVQAATVADAIEQPETPAESVEPQVQEAPAEMPAAPAPASAQDPATAATTPEPAQALPPAETNAANQAEQAEADASVASAPIATGTHISPQVAAATHVAAGHPQPHPAAEVAKPATVSASAMKADARRFRTLSMRARVATRLQATDSPNPPKLMMLKAGNIGITNLDLQVPVHFAFRAFPGDWTNQTLAPNLSKELGCGMPGANCLFWMRTGAKPAVFYKMQAAKRYGIFWNASDGIWDMREAIIDD